VQAWRQRHPGYWRRAGAVEPSQPELALQDVCVPQPLDEQLVHALSNRLSMEIAAPLQDVLRAQQHALVGLTALMTGGALQEDIAAVLLACYERGQRIGGMVPWMRSLEVGHAKATVDSAAAAPAHSAAVQLGGPPVGA
jgi:hypothetical protein